jgi:hypothetical protein
MSQQPAIKPKKPRKYALFVLLGALVLGTGIAQDELEREGYFEVRSASTEIVDGVYALDARTQLVLSSEALAALESGVTLTIELQLQVIRSRRFMIDDVEAELAIGFERSLNSGEQDSFATLYSALNSLGRVQGLPIIDEAVLSPDSTYRVRLRAMLNTERYPAALRVLFFWRGQWQLQSEWFEWLLER